MSSVPIINDKIENNLVAVILTSPSSIGVSHTENLRKRHVYACVQELLNK